MDMKKNVGGKRIRGEWRVALSEQSGYRRSPRKSEFEQKFEMKWGSGYRVLEEEHCRQRVYKTKLQ